MRKKKKKRRLSVVESMWGGGWLFFPGRYSPTQGEGKRDAARALLPTALTWGVRRDTPPGHPRRPLSLGGEEGHVARALLPTALTWG
jgi:hypothetical protein